MRRSASLSAADEARHRKILAAIDAAGRVQNALEELARESPTLWDVAPFAKAYAAAAVVTTRLTKVAVASHQGDL
jgi:hypothetical protein